jgi:hypothetical protein
MMTLALVALVQAGGARCSLQNFRTIRFESYRRFTNISKGLQAYAKEVRRFAWKVGGGEK